MFATKELSSRLPREVLLRVLADTVIINLSLIAAFVLRLYLLLIVENVQVSANVILHEYANSYLRSAWLITLIGLVSFYSHGFYTYGRAYRGRFKALIIVEATTLSYIVFSAISFFAADLFPMPRGVVVFTWAFSLAMLLVARLWATQWTAVIKAEERLLSGLARSKDTKNILVIGGAGYIGSALLPKLLDKGYKVRVLDLLIYGLEPIKHVLEHPNLEVVQADFRHVDAVVDAMNGMDAVVHLGAIVGDPACALNESLTIEVNLTATRMIADVAKGSGIKQFVFASTCSVYGTGTEILDESSQLNPVSLYACTKMAAEWVLNSLSGPEFGPTILRFGTIYGFSGRTRFDLVINLLTAKALVDGEITVFGGKQWRPFVHVQDAANAILKVIEAPLGLVKGQTFNVGSNEQNYTIEQAAELIHGQVPRAAMVNMGGDTDLRDYRVNFDKIRTYLSFTHEWTVERGVQQVMSAFRNGQITDYREARYSNVKFLKEDGQALLYHLGSNIWENDLLNKLTDEHTRVPGDFWRKPDTKSNADHKPLVLRGYLPFELDTGIRTEAMQ